MPSSNRQYVGAMARLSLDAIKRADQLQLAATTRIGDEFETRDPEPEKSQGMSLEQFLTDMERAVQAGMGEEYDAMLAQMLAPVIDQVLSQQKQGVQ